MSDVTRILSQIEQGDPAAPERLLPLVYDELRMLAGQMMTQENPGQTLQATALVHEAYLRLVGVDHEQHWENRGHFFAAAAQAMRRIVVDNARRKNRQKHGGARKRKDLDDIPIVLPDVHEDLIALDEALDRLRDVNSRAVELVHLRYFVGLSNAEAARLLNISSRTADRLWSFARAWLHQEIRTPEGDRE